MFTGLVARGEVVGHESSEDGARLWVSSDDLADAEPGASVSVDGVCLTVAERDGPTCRFDLSRETLVRSALGERRVGDRVNLERALRVGDELGGHIVQGHVDGVGRISRVLPDGDGTRVTVEAPEEVLRYVVEKGSITVDGVSLTVTRLDPGTFEVALIPHTLEVTTFGEAAEGRSVNLEVDVLAKYVEKLIGPRIRVPEGTDTGYL